MPPPSEAALRYSIIDRCLTNPYKPFPSMEALKKTIEHELNCKVSEATIQKDIHAMKLSEELGYLAPIKFKKSHNGYYYTDPNYTIQTFGLNDREIEAIELAAGVLQHFKGIKVNDTYNHAIDKLFSAVNIKKSDKETDLSNAIQPEESTYMRGMEHFDALVSCIKKKIPVSFIHYSYDKKLFKANIIHPYLLKESNKRWYLVGFSEEHEEVRYFGLDRVYDPVALNIDFKENVDPELRNIFKNKIGLNTIHDNQSEQAEEILLWVSRTMSNYLLSMPLHATQQIVQHGMHGSLELTVHLVPTYELITTILSYGSHMEVIKPQWLRLEIEKELLMAANKYKS